MVNELREVEKDGRFLILIGDKDGDYFVRMRITRVASRLPARWVGCFIARSESVHFSHVTVVDSKDCVEFPWKFSGGTHYLDRGTHDTMTFYLTMADIQRLKEG